LEHHDIDPSGVVVVPHGARVNLSGPPGLVSERPIVLTWGLLGPGKGIELGIEAVAKLRETGIEVSYVVAGETHPNVRAREGERYRESLAALARLHSVEDLVQFDDQYRDWESLRAIVRSATVVLLPYESRDQVTSGVLVEALAAGKPVVATSFPHAVELAQSGAVSVVPHHAPTECAAAIAAILRQPLQCQAMSQAAAGIAEQHDWTNVGARLKDLILNGIRAARCESG
jgi:glycosyltransferase involved in cell wall biosynthesis